MIASLRWASPLIFLTAVLIALVIARPSWLRPRAGSSSASSLIHEPPEQARILQNRIEARFAITDRLLAGEMTLPEAAAWFRYLNNSPPRFASPYHQWPGASEGEKLCRQVIHWVRMR